MSRVKGGTVTHARHKKITTAAKGYSGRRRNVLLKTATPGGRQSEPICDP